jgi:hypothetical protein
MVGHQSAVRLTPRCDDQFRHVGDILDSGWPQREVRVHGRTLSKPEWGQPFRANTVISFFRTRLPVRVEEIAASPGTESRSGHTFAL